MAEVNPIDASLPPRCPMDVAFELREDDTRVPLSSSVDSDDFVFVETTHPNKVLEGLNRLRLDNALCDVVLCCRGQDFPAHRNVLASFSSYFEAMFTMDLMESKQERVILNGVEPQMIDMLLTFAYTSTVVISTTNVQALLAASNLLNVTAVEEACCHYMERHMDENNCVAIHCLAEAYSCQMLEKSSMDYLLEHFGVIYQQEAFLSLSVDKLMEILASDDLNVLKEEMAMEAAMLWLNKCPTHIRSFEKVLEQIRLPFISPSDLHDVIECLDVVKESQGCQRLLSEAKSQNLLPFSHRAQQRWSTVREVIVMVGGDADDEDLPLSLACFDPLTRQWRTLGCLPSHVCLSGLVVSGSALYLAGGCFDDESVSREMWRYDRSHDSWLEMAPMNEARCAFSMVMLDGYVFAVGGIGDIDTSDTVERYNPKTNAWQLLESVRMPDTKTVIASPAVVTLDGLIYVIDGEGMAQVYAYDPKSSVWTKVAPMQMKRTEPAACTLNGRIYVIGGEIGEVSTYATSHVECYNPKTNQWTMCAPMKKRRHCPAVAVVEEKIYVVGGLYYEDLKRYHDTIERYCEETDTWELVGEMPTSHSRHLRCVSLRMRMDGQPTCHS